MEQEHIQYAWGTNILANVITFKTHGQIVAIDPSGIIDDAIGVNRLPAYIVAVEQAERPAIIQLVRSDELQPLVLSILDQEHITYRVARFPSEPGIDVIVVTPLNRTAPVISAPAFRPLFECQRMYKGSYIQVTN
jgi:hypothetical protein